MNETIIPEVDAYIESEFKKLNEQILDSSPKSDKSSDCGFDFMELRLGRLEKELSKIESLDDVDLVPKKKAIENSSDFEYIDRNKLRNAEVNQRVHVTQDELKKAGREMDNKRAEEETKLYDVVDPIMKLERV